MTTLNGRFELLYLKPGHVRHLKDPSSLPDLFAHDRNKRYPFRIRHVGSPNRSVASIEFTRISEAATRSSLLLKEYYLMSATTVSDTTSLEEKLRLLIGIESILSMISTGIWTSSKVWLRACRRLMTYMDWASYYRCSKRLLRLPRTLSTMQKARYSTPVTQMTSTSILATSIQI